MLNFITPLSRLLNGLSNKVRLFAGHCNITFDTISEIVAAVSFKT